MGNLLQYTDRSESIDKKLSILLSDIEHQYQNGEIKTETEYYYRVKNAVADFYKSLGNPTFRYRPAEYVPVSSHYNDMVSEAIEDIKYIINDCGMLTEVLDRIQDDSELWRKMLDNNITYLEQRVNEINERNSKNVPDGTVVFTENFQKDNGRYKHDPYILCIDASSGILTLPYSSRNETLLDGITIDPDISNGLPGNTHCVDVRNSNLHYIGNDGLHNEISSMCNSSSDEWFEYEIFTISDAVREQTNNFGFCYSEGISWLGKPPLILSITAKAKLQPWKSAWLVIEPYLPDIKGVKPFTAGECTIVSTDGQVHKITDSEDMDGTKIFMFEPCYVKEVRLTFFQDNGYPVNVGHWYYTKVNSKSMSIFQEYDTSDIYARVEGQMPSVTSLGVKYVPEKKWVNYDQSDIQKDKYAKNDLFMLPASTTEKTAQKEIIEAERYMIGIKSISLRAYDFYSHGYYYSKIFTTEQPIDSVILDAYEYIPGEDTEALEYFLTFDSGVNWHKIYPVCRSYAGVYKYTINNDTIANMMAINQKEKRTKNIMLMEDAYSVQLKITMKRDENTPNASPVVYRYKLHIETGGNNIEY